MRFLVIPPLYKGPIGSGNFLSDLGFMVTIVGHEYYEDGQLLTFVGQRGYYDDTDIGEKEV